MSLPRFCSVEDNQESARRALEQRPRAVYGPVSVLIVDSSEDGMITFEALNVNNVRTCYSLRWGEDMWIDCPSTLPSIPPKPPVKGASGILYLSGRLRDVFPDLVIDVKWPDRKPETIYQPLEIFPTSIVVKGVEVADGQFTEATIELLDPRMAAASQTIVLNGGAITLSLSQAGFAEFLLGFPTSDAGSQPSYQDAEESQERQVLAGIGARDE